MKTETMDLNTYAAMQSGRPVKTYKKTILGQLYCTILDPFTNEARGIILSGDPKKNDESAMVDTWSDIQDLYFRRTNKKSLETGMLIVYNRPENLDVINPEPFAAASDEELDAVLSQKYYSLISSLNKCTNTTVLHRFLDRARALEKSEKIVNTIISRISELDSGATEE